MAACSICTYFRLHRVITTFADIAAPVEAISELQNGTHSFIMRSDMVKAKIKLQGKGDDWQVKDTTIDYDGQEVQRLGPIDQMMEYEEAIKEAKRWTMLMIRGRNRKETEDDIIWDIDPSLPPKHIPKL